MPANAGRRGPAIRPARPGDCAGIASLAAAFHCELGERERSLTAEAIRRDGFGCDPHFDIVVAENDEGDLSGYVLFAPAYESPYAARGFYINDLYVTPSARRRGIARALIEAVKRRARAEGRRFVWWVSAPENHQAQAFYDTLGPQNERHVKARAIVLD